METPDITPVQVRAVVLWVVSFLSLFGVFVADITADKYIALASGLVTALPVILIYADAVIRKARAQNASAISAAKTQAYLDAAPGPPSFGGDSL